MHVAHYLTVQEIAERYRVAPQTVRGWLHRKQLRKSKIGGRVLVEERDLSAFLKTEEAETETPQVMA